MLIICDESWPCCCYSMAIICVCDINVVVASWGHWALGTLAVVTVVMVTISQLTRRQPAQPSTARHSVWGPQRAVCQLRVRVRLVFRRHFYFHPLLKTSSYGIHQSCHSHHIFSIPYFIHIDEMLRLDSTFNAAWLITSREGNDDTVTT